MGLLRLATAGSVDDGKSTLIGRLLYDARALREDQLAALERSGQARGEQPAELALLLDGLKAEREQGITIDVAWRSFTTARRRFLLADTPGHVQYTRNMVTGASGADVALILVDASKGVLEQTRRHLAIAALLCVPHVVVCVNKMDLMGWAEDVFAALAAEVQRLCLQLGRPPPTAIPLCALQGDNVVRPSAHMPWYTGPTLLSHLEQVPHPAEASGGPLRLPVQCVLRSPAGSQPQVRAQAGQLVGGRVRPGEVLVALSSGLTSRVQSLWLGERPLAEACAPQSVSLVLEDALDVGRGDLLCRPEERPLVAQDFEAVVCWLSEQPLRPGTRLALKHTTRWARALVHGLHSRLDVHTLAPQEGCTSLGLNALGRLTLRTSVPLFVDAYRHNRHTGSFILIDEGTQATVAAGMFEGVAG